MNLQESNDQLLRLINASVSPYHTVQEGIRMLKEAGFEEWKLDSSEPLEAGKAYYTDVYGTTLIAFRMPKQEIAGYRIATGHTDWPCFRIKPNPDQTTALYHKLNVEMYGGAISNTWLDRPLLLAGRICLKGENAFSPKEILYSSKKPVAVIPNLAIHMNREVNRGVELKVQTDMEILLTYLNGSKPNGLLDRIAAELGVDSSEILDCDLYAANAEQGRLIGFDEEMIQSPRLDNLTSCASCLHGIIVNDSLENQVSMIALFDNEECGSRSKQGAGSVVLASLLEKILLCSGKPGRLNYLNTVSDSFIVSLDVAHATHPNHPEKADPTNPIHLDGGVILKLSTNQRYATDPSAVAVVEGICRDNEIAHQKFVNHGDIPGGGTLGSILSATIPAKTVDIGVPLLGMHSSCELMAASSQLAMDQFVEAYFSETGKMQDTIA